MMLCTCMSITDEDQQPQFQKQKLIGTGTFGQVFLAQTRSKSHVAIKTLFVKKNEKNRQLELLQECDHPNVIKLLHHFYENNQKQEKYLNLVFQYFPQTLTSFVDEVRAGRATLTPQFQRSIIQQILKGVHYLHSKGIVHRDLKPQNILINSAKGTVKICDLGSAKKLKAGEKNSFYISSRYYRAPELILESQKYSEMVDIWSVGCIMAFTQKLQSIFRGQSSILQFKEIVRVLGTPSKQDMAVLNPNLLSREMLELKGVGLQALLKKCDQQLLQIIKRALTLNPSKRASAQQLLQSDYVKGSG